MTAFLSWQLLDLVLKHLDLFEYVVHMLSFGWQRCRSICLSLIWHKSPWRPHIGWNEWFLLSTTFLSHSLGTFLIKSCRLTLLPWWLIRGYRLLVLRFLLNFQNLVRGTRTICSSGSVIYGLLVCLLAFAQGTLHISRHCWNWVTILLKLLSLSSLMIFRVFSLWLENGWLLLKTRARHQPHYDLFLFRLGRLLANGYLLLLLLLVQFWLIALHFI